MNYNYIPSILNDNFFKTHWPNTQRNYLGTEQRSLYREWRNSGSFPKESRDLSFLQSFEAGSWPHQPSSHSTGAPFSRG